MTSKLDRRTSIKGAITLAAIAVTRNSYAQASRSSAPAFLPGEINRISAYLKQKFRLQNVHIRVREHEKDTAELMVGEEFFGLIILEADQTGRSFNLQGVILESDLQ